MRRAALDIGCALVLFLTIGTLPALILLILLTAHSRKARR